MTDPRVRTACGLVLDYLSEKYPLTFTEIMTDRFYRAIGQVEQEALELHVDTFAHQIRMEEERPCGSS